LERGSSLVESYLEWKRLAELGREAGESADLESVEAKLSRPLSAVYIVGVGGSGAVGSFLASVSDLANVPVVSYQGLGLPGPVSSSTLVLAISYSGNTLETLLATKRALEKGAPVVGVTSGGKLAELLRCNV